MRLMARIEKSKAAAKAKSKSKKNASTALAAKKATAPAEPRATMKRPAAVVEESLSKFPRADLKKSVCWGGGRIHKASGNMIRAYPRVGDRNDKRFSIK